MLTIGLSGRCWPAHVQPLDDESVSSWVLRLSAAHRLKVHTFAALTWPGRAVWTRDIDRSATRAFTDRLAERTTCDAKRAWRTTLGALADREPTGSVLPAPYQPNGRVRGVLDAGVYHRVRRRYGQQYCPDCWADDPVVYVRRLWRLAAVTACALHGTPLRDACPACDAPIMVHHYDVGDRRVVPPATLVPRCVGCRANLRRLARSAAASRMARRAAGRVVGGALTPDAAWLHAQLGAAYRSGTADLGESPVAAEDWFALVRHFTRLAGTGRIAHRLTTAVATCGGPPPPTVADAPVRPWVEAFRHADRYALGGVVAWLLSEWPARLLAVAAAADLWSSDLLRDLSEPPAVLRAVVVAHRYAPLACTSPRWTSDGPARARVPRPRAGVPSRGPRI